MFSRIGTANLPTVGISAITITCLYSCKTYLEPYLMRRFQLKSIAIPIDILSVRFSPVFIEFLNLFTNFYTLPDCHFDPSLLRFGLERQPPGGPDSQDYCRF